MFWFGLFVLIGGFLCVMLVLLLFFLDLSVHLVPKSKCFFYLRVQVQKRRLLSPASNSPLLTFLLFYILH